MSCGSGTQSRMRACDSPAQAGAGLDCVGDLTEFQSCNTESCDSKYPLQSDVWDCVFLDCF